MRSSRPSITTSTSMPAFNPAASATAFGIRTPRPFPHLARLTFMGLRFVRTMYIIAPTYLHRLRPPRDGDDAGARHFDEAERQHQVDELIDLLRAAGDLENEALGGG